MMTIPIPNSETRWCAWPKGTDPDEPIPPAGQPKTTRVGWDTTRANVGRRKNGVCGGTFCLRHVDQPGDEFCRVCRRRQ